MVIDDTEYVTINRLCLRLQCTTTSRPREMTRFSSIWYWHRVCLLSSSFASITRRLHDPLEAKKIHLCAYRLKKKEKFNNIYIQEYRPQIYTGFIEDHLTNVHKDAFYNIEDDAPDFEKSLLREAQRRRKMYKKKRFLKEMGVQLKPSLPQFTSDQLLHIKFLHNEDPRLWTASKLAMSFGVEVPVIKSILRSKIETIATDTNTPDSSNFVRYSDDKTALIPIPYQPLLNPNVEDVENTQSIKQKDPDLEQNRWFQTFQASKENEKLVEVDEMEELEEMLKEETVSEEHDELFDEENNEFDNEIDDNEKLLGDADENDVNDHVDFKDDDVLQTTSADNVNFYDKEGRFLFRIS